MEYPKVLTFTGDRGRTFLAVNQEDEIRLNKIGFQYKGESLVPPLTPQQKAAITIKRKADFGGDITFNSYAELEKDFKEGKLAPGDLKPAVADAINGLLEPVR